MSTESSSSPATVPIIPSSSSPAVVPTIPSAVPLINPDSSQATTTNVDNHQTSGPSSSTEAAFPHARK